MSDTGWVSPGTVVSDGTIGDVAWSNPSNAKASDNSYSTVDPGGPDMFEDFAVKIVKSDGSIGSTNKGGSNLIPSSDTYITYGGSSDLWSETWSASDINDSDFGVVYSVSGGEGYYSEYLKATNFDFSIPTGSTIDGIEARVEHSYYYSGMPPPIERYCKVDHIQIKVYYTETGTPTVGTKYALPAFKRP
jgi:hypothetical protein